MIGRRPSNSQAEIRRAGQTARNDLAISRRGDQVRREERSGYRSETAARNLADGDDDARAAVGRTVLSRRRNDPGRVSYQHDVARAKDDEHARQQSAFRPRHGLSRTDSRPPSAGIYDRALPTLSRYFCTPFWTEGWALYWELLLWDLGFDKTPEDRIGALFWRMHRCARIIFSLSFHLEKMTPQEAWIFWSIASGTNAITPRPKCGDHFRGSYGPLYQIAYMMGGLQFYSLHHELVDCKEMTEREFHDCILREGPIPVEIVRAILTTQKLSREQKPSWRFYQLEK